MEFMKMVLSTAKNLLNNKSVQEILKYLTYSTLSYASTRFRVDQYKYEPLDMKNMIYNHNMNNYNKIDTRNTDQMINLLCINRFIEELNKNNQEKISMDELVLELSKVCKDESLSSIYKDMKENNFIKLFDRDTLETSSIADNYEISSGGIYIPNRSIKTVTDEGSMLADAKNEYLEKRIELGRDVSSSELIKLLQGYYSRIKYDDMVEHFKN